MLLQAVLWMQDAWQWSALRAGFGVAPGPAIVPFCSVLAGKLIPRHGPSRVVVAGSVCFAAGLSWWAALSAFRTAWIVLAMYRRGPDGGHHPYAVMVVSVSAAGIAQIVVFRDPALLDVFEFAPC